MHNRDCAKHDIKFIFVYLEFTRRGGEKERGRKGKKVVFFLRKMIYSPLRYPGGKNKLAPFLERVCVKNEIDGHYVEPYAGGAGVALYLLMRGHVREITINDKDRALYAFWYSVVKDTDNLCNLISNTRVSIATWHKQKEVQSRKRTAKLLELGFSTFFLNRTNRSGIIDGGPIGGMNQTGEYLINCRFNKKELIRRIKALAAYKDVIHVKNMDALDLVTNLKKNGKFSKNTIFYFDPPYYLKGESLYLNNYKHDDHRKVAKAISSIKNAHWIVTYDYTLPITKLYNKFKSKKYTLWHTAHSTKKGKEIMFISKYLLTPRKIFL